MYVYCVELLIFYGPTVGSFVGKMRFKYFFFELHIYQLNRYSLTTQTNLGDYKLCSNSPIKRTFALRKT